MSLFSRLFGGGKKDETGESDQSAIYYFVRCGKCGEAIRIRINRQSDLAQEFEGQGDFPSGYSVSKEIIGQKCFNRIEFNAHFDSKYREVDKQIRGGAFITRQEYEQAQAPSA